MGIIPRVEALVRRQSDFAHPVDKPSFESPLALSLIEVAGLNRNRSNLQEELKVQYRVSMKRIIRIIFGVALGSVAVCVFLCWKVLGLIPHIPDELAYLYQGRILSTGHLWVPAPAVPEAFTVKWDHILRDGDRWRALYPPGLPLLFALGWLIHAPFLINPMLLGITVIGLFFLAKVLFDERTALFAVAVFVASPFVLLMSAGFMAHPANLCASVWCVFFLCRGGKNDFLMAGILGSFAFLVRPYTAFALLLPAFLWCWLKTKDRKQAALRILTGCIPLLLLNAAYNHVLFSSAFRSGYSYDPDAAFRGSYTRYLFQNFPWYITGLNRGLWGFPWPDLLIFVPLLAPHKNWRKDLMLLLCICSLLFAYSIFYYRDIVYGGPRYVYEAVGFLAILAARSIQLIGRKYAPLLLLLFIYPLISSLPGLMEYHSTAYHGQSKELIDLVKTKGIGEDSLILISGNPHVFRTFYLENGLDPAESQRVFARDIPGKRSELMKAYPRKETWSMNIELKMIPGPNQYEDRAIIRGVKWERISTKNPASS
jgi:hypothetical protein